MANVLDEYDLDSLLIFDGAGTILYDATGIYDLGDNADLPTAKLGSAAVRQARTVVEDVSAELAGRAPEASYDGRSECFVETGRGLLGRA